MLNSKKNDMRIAFAASRDLSVEIIKWIHLNKNLFHIELVGGIAPKFKGWWDDKVYELYETLEIPIFSNIEELIDKSKPDLIFSLNYWKIIPLDYISKVNKGIINIHHSYKLRFRGRYSTSWAIIHARKDDNWWHGTTIHYIDKELDNGKIIATRKCLINSEDTAESLFEKVEDLAIKMFKENFKIMLNGNVANIQADPIFFYYDINSNKNLEIDINLPTEDIYDFIRAWSFKDLPKPYFMHHGRKIFLSLEDV